MKSTTSYKASEKFKYVSFLDSSNKRFKNNSKKWRAYLQREPYYSEYFDTEIEAAKAIDIELIKRGCEPINILKRK